MTKGDQELRERMEQVRKELLEAAIRIREKSPGLSYGLYQYSKTAEDAVRRLTPVKRDPEGGGGSWFAVCEECRGQVGELDQYCRHCGRPLEGE